MATTSARKPAAKATPKPTVARKASAAKPRPVGAKAGAAKPKPTPATPKASAAKPKPTPASPKASAAKPKPAAAPTRTTKSRARVVVVPEPPLAEVITLSPSRPRRRGRAARPVVPVALGSLTQPGARSGDTCEQCGTERVTSLALVLTDGTPVRFTSCHACEHRTWLGPNGPLDRDTVLERTRKIR